MAESPNPTGGSPASTHVLQAPTGTRDFYPADLNKLRFIQDAWRRTSINFGFEEIDGPTFEHLDLYKIKSGEGIVSELFSFERFGGEKTFALRPEFTPTLARLYAARANALPKPTKWYWVQNCFRAERPQRGRLREFYQWNCDILGDESARADAEIVATCVGLLESLGLTEQDVRVRFSSRALVSQLMQHCGARPETLEAGLNLLDRRGKVDAWTTKQQAEGLGLDLAKFDALAAGLSASGAGGKGGKGESEGSGFDRSTLHELETALRASGVAEWCTLDLSIVRGLAYYTGMVFEVHEATGAERAIAGGGRYDKLIEMFGGPATPAVGFGMGDVVLSLVLADKGKFPSDEAIAERLGLRPDALVISNGTPEADAMVGPVLASMRRAGLHARPTYKQSKNVGKLIQDAAKQRARVCVILESGTMATVKDLSTQEQAACAIGELVERVRGNWSRPPKI